jgi:hypothetical protein
LRWAPQLTHDVTRDTREQALADLGFADHSSIAVEWESCARSLTTAAVARDVRARVIEGRVGSDRTPRDVTGLARFFGSRRSLPSDSASGS